MPNDLASAWLEIYDGLGIQLDVVRADFMRHYQLLAAAKANGKTMIRGSGWRREYCVIARELIDGKKYYVDDPINAYRAPFGPVPILPHPLCEMLNAGEDGESAPCLCNWAPMPTAANAWMEATSTLRNETANIQDNAMHCLKLLQEKHTDALAQLELANQGTLPWEEYDRLTIIASLGIKQLRQLQKWYGVRGFRTKGDIAVQLLSLPNASTDLMAVVSEEHARVAQLNRAHIEYLRRLVALLATAIAQVSKSVEPEKHDC